MNTKSSKLHQAVTVSLLALSVLLAGVGAFLLGEAANQILSAVSTGSI